ncbi:MAG: hypothetical protein Q9167_002079 [Letrouitia subvulpina]
MAPAPVEVHSTPRSPSAKRTGGRPSSVKSLGSPRSVWKVMVNPEQLRNVEPTELSEAINTTPKSTPKEDQQASQSSLRNTPSRSIASPIDIESYFNSFGSLSSSRPNSIYSISRLSLSSQLSQLTSLHLPNASSLSTSISAIPSAPSAAKAFSSAAEHMRKWLRKAIEVLGGLDAEDDVEWAAAGGRDGLEEVDAAIGKFEELIHVYVKAIEDLQERADIADVPSEELKALVEQMEKTLGDWNNVRKLLKGVKSQVELAMEWEELWNVVLGDIGQEMESILKLIFEMEEARHRSLVSDFYEGNGLDMSELETIVEEHANERHPSSSHRFDVPPAFSADSPLTSPSFQSAQDDSTLLALFARMQPLRASLDFLPMTLANFRSRAEQILPTACKELEDRRKGLEKKWAALQSDADLLRRELSEDRWVLVFRNAGRQAEKLCESVERSIGKLQECIDAGSQHNNTATLAKKVENYEAKKMHYGPAIERVLIIIEKGVKDRLTINGEVLRLRSESRARWTAVEGQIKEMDLALEDFNMNKNQQLRDSISTIVSIDRSAPASVVDTPRSSPASSIMMGTPNGSKGETSSYGTNGSNRRSNVSSNNTSRPNSSRHAFTVSPASSNSTQLPRKSLISRSVTSDSWSASRSASPSTYSKRITTNHTPSTRPQRPSLPSDRKPRWNSSPKIDYNDFRPYSKSSPLTAPSGGRKSSLSFRLPEDTMRQSSSSPQIPPRESYEKSPQGSTPFKPKASPSLAQRPRLPSGARTSLGHHQLNSTSSYTGSQKRESLPMDSSVSSPLSPHAELLMMQEADEGNPAPGAHGRRTSRLPTPSKSSMPLSSSQSTAMGVRTVSGGRQSSLGPRSDENNRR